MVTNHNNKEESIHKRVADIINFPSKAVAPSTQINISLQQKLAMQTFNTDSLRPHLNKLGSKNTGATVSPGNNPRVAQSHSPTHIHRKVSNETDTKSTSFGLKQALASMNQTFIASSKNNRGVS